MKKIISIIGTVLVLTGLMGWFFYRRASTNIRTLEHPVHASEADRSSGAASSEEENGSTTPASDPLAKDGMTSDKTGLLAQKLLAAMLGGGAAEKAATLDPASLWDASVSFDMRRRMVWRLAQSDDPEDFRLLTEYLMSAEGDSSTNAEVRLSIVESVAAATGDAAPFFLGCLTDTEKGVVGTAVLTLSNGEALNYSLKGKLNAKKGEGRFKLKGLGAAKGSNIQMDTDLDYNLLRLKGKVMGQKIEL